MAQKPISARVLSAFFALFLALGASALLAENLRIATYGSDLGRFGPGILLSDLEGGRDEQIAALIKVLVRLDADILLLTDVDYDARGQALAALVKALKAQGLSYPYTLALQPNSGMPTGLDLNGDGALGTAEDAMGFGRFAGADGMALLSRFPIDRDGTRDFSDLLWRDLPGHLMPPSAARVAQIQRLSSTGHWDVPILLPSGSSLHVLAYAATPPVFDGPEDRNGRRNHDESALWLAYLAGKLAVPSPSGALVVLGNSNLDPVDGAGLGNALSALLTHPRLKDPQPKGSSARVEADHKGDPALDTAFFETGAGGLRVDVVLPSQELIVTGSGVLWPSENDPFAATLGLASRHRPVWIDVEMP